ncbi:sushi, von Willebrand factor type A, EGF and pentraxin domain-containing protein 1-like [Centruroides sculpturatus]|uniref:sushi, von Willebrand factor type A, EGF and pentraxin domain-containing protein 1-like n=1 Tax=Centruroides sculpturatus TaxID=218467 RepID=UPI000C6E226C|nr:sushi, von Willebrand factor type A, EGF and pentraxin domain-containing protein 1-like [Centruroides sculpturatus]
METAMNILKTAAQKGELDLSLGSRRVKIEHLRFKRSNPKFVCEPGSVIEGNQCIKCPVGTFFNVLFEYCEGCSLGTYQFQEGQLSCLVCPERTSTTTGQSKSVGECKAQCLPGSFSSTGLEVCETCPRGYYQPHYAQTSCLSCPGLTTTWRRGARRQDECQETCPPGYVSTTGLFPCFACPIGYFQPAAGEKACYRCPNGATTNSQGSTSVNDCAGMNKILKDDKLTIPLSDLLLVNDCFSVPCLNGATCEALDFGFLCHCVPGYTGIYCENEINECESTPCKNNATCRDLLNDYVCVCLPGFTGNLCQKNIDECAYEPCLNGGICTDHINKFSCKCPEGYVGPVCQYNIDDCLSNPCQNGATCQDLIANYTCHCIRGFTGRNCETNIDDCADDFCQNNATCIDGIEEFICQCLPGFRGRLCEDDVNECQSEPCMNGATCFDQIAHFTCLCAPSFTGDLCETELSQDFFLVFPSSGTLDFLQLEGFQHPLDHVTVCLWMTTVDKHNYGTPLSYANETVDNLFTLTDYNGFVFYINMQEVVTDVTANDGKWHHICVTWSSPTGAWSIYKDGEQADKGIGLAVGTFIPTDGILVVGQEQDGKGSGFSSPESFIGSMSLLQIWDYVLTPEEISTFTTRCDNYKGNVRAWSDFLGGIFGRVEKKSSDFCRGCNTPAVLIHGDVTVSGVKTNALATYLCHPGYKITGSVSRKCMVYGDWSGESPSCTRISCGFPGYLNNGFISGRSYLYQDTIQYFCNSGYHLKGGSIRTCQADGYWKGEPPYCEEILCSPPLPLENGKVITSLRKYKPSHKVQFKCDDGYKLDGASYLICGNDGQWNQSQPVCQPKSCESPPRVLHGQVVGQQQKFEVGSVVYYKCNNGYMISNSNAVKCAIKSRWEGDIPRCERVNCGLPPVIPNANYEGRDHKFGGVITYRCELGYELVSNGEISCLENGVWSKPIPHCKPVSCGKLVTPENGYIQVNNYTFSNVAKYFCNTGYELQGIRSRKCRATRDWSGESPVCVPVSCSQPESIPNGKFVGNDWTVGNIVTYSCHPGYMLKGEMERVCLESGQWLHETPMCDPIECSPPDHVQHARIHGKDYHFGHRVEYQCEIGYELIGQAIRVCLEDQHWGPEPPICRPVSCGRPIQIENGEVITTNNTFTGEANYRCQVGFRLEGNQRRRCLADGKWDGLDPSCEIIKCAEPMQVQHAYLLYSDVRYGSVVEYYCDEGYKLKGLSQRICREDGFWEGEEPYCETIRCQSPSVIENGDIMVPDTKFGTHISYSCHRGYELEGPSSRVCQQDEQWSGKEPKCLPIYCPDDELKLPNGHIKLESNLMGSVILYSCDVGFELIGLISRTCQENKEWEGMPPICAKVTCPPPIPPLNGEVVWFNHSFGDSITYSCHKGYTLQGDLHRICLPDGTWSNQEPFCEPIKCSLPSNIEYGYVRYDNLNYRSKVKYSCHNGYKLIGSKYIECRADHSWDGAVPHCEQILCPEPPPIKYGHHMTENFTIGSRAIYACDKGFIMDSSKLECNANGKWIGKIPSCNIVSCSAPSKFKFGKIIGKNFTYGNTIHFKCNSGWELIGNSVLFCEETGNWNSSYPSCIGTFCPSPEVIHHGQIIATDLKYGTSITYHCNPGYQLIGDSYRKCEIDNTWSGKPPKCLPVLCPEPPDIAQGTKIGNLFEFGSNVTFECNHGYLLHGLSTLHCLENGTWSASIPVCVEVSCSIPERVKNGEVVVPIRKRQYQKDDSMQADEGFLLGHRGDITVDSDMIIEASQSDIFRLGARVIYKCAKGFHLEGERMRTCQKDGHWSGETPYCKAVSCNNVSSIENGNVSVSTITFLSEINYTCNSGYKLIGSNKRICLSNGSWSGNSPHCVLIKCSQPSSIPHGNVKWDNLNYGGIAMYECNTGYRLIGNVSRICQNNEHWSGLEPNCQPLECTKLTNPNNGWVQTNSLMVGTLAKYGCKEGYELTGPAIRTCLMNETWSSTIPSCHITSCFPLPAVKYGYIIGLKFTFGSVVKYKCYTGYTLIGPAERSCLANKSWSGESPQCNPLNCPRPHAPHHGSVYVPKLAVGSYANYSCYEGYELRGNSSRMCMPELMWSGDVPNCVIINCSSVTTIPYGSVMYTNFTFGSAVKFSCLPKYQLLGSEEIWCLPNKEWSSDIPTCNRYICDNLNNDKHTLISPLGPHQVGQTVKFNCIMGYQLQGKNMLKCDANGHWEQSIPRCIPVECGPPPEIMNGRISFLSNNKSNSIQYMYKSKIAYVCNDGYELNGSRVLECERDGYWVGEKPQCIEVNCGHPPIVHHSTVQVEHKPGLSTAIYLCNYGYKLIGSEKHFCKDGKEWNINNTHCEKIFCGPPPYFQYSKSINLLSNNYEVGSYVTYTCLPGYENIGGESLSCSEENKWIGRIPNCLPISCSKPPAPKHGIVKGEEYTFQSIVLYSCDKGYKLIGKDTRECQSDGKWGGDIPECKIIHCNELNEPRNGYLWKEVEIRQPIVGDRIWFSCENGYNLVGSESIQCQENGLWKPEIPHCAAITCPPPTDYPPKTVIIKHEEMFSFGDQLAHVCEAGYRPDGDLTIKCLENGTWSQPNGICSKVSCGRPQINNGGIVLGMSYMYHDKVVIKCPPGSKSSGKVVLTCKGNGKWNDEPYCQALCPHPCLNGGHCIPPGICACPPGFAGELCQQAICILPCLNGGTCIEPYKCSCEEGFTGSRCETAICQPHCQNSGLCIAPNLCRCRINFRGPQCQYENFRNHRPLTRYKY